jgi:DNA-binding MarR family transcriptional regulator
VTDQRGVPTELSDAGPTARLMYSLLDQFGPLTLKQLTQLSQSRKTMAHSGVTKLVDEGVVVKRLNPDDGRQNRVVLTDQPVADSEVVDRARV